MALVSSNAVVGATLLVFATGSASAADSPTGKISLQPILDARVRYENVDEMHRDAEGFTFRLRGGAVAKIGKISILVEGEGTAALINNYNAFPFALPGEDQWRPTRSVIVDPSNLELNRLQVEYKSAKHSLTLGRQRIDLDDQRWVGSVGWRQNEQTFDAIRGQATVGPVAFDIAYAISQRTIFGNDAGPRTSYKGNFVLASAGTRVGRLEGKVFAYLLDCNEAFFFSNSTQTYGFIMSSAIPINDRVSLSLKGSYARQSDYASNQFDYSADYWSTDLGARYSGLSISAGIESLGSDNGRAVQTPMATLHKFNGWADKFLSTPANGLRDRYLSVSQKFPRLRGIRDLSATVTHHRFDSNRGDMHYGNEWDASLGFKIGKLGFLAKVADYNSKDLGNDIRKFWIQAEWALK